MLPGARFRVALKARIVKLNPKRGAGTAVFVGCGAFWISIGMVL